MLLGSVSSQQRFGVTDIKAPNVSQLSGLEQTVLQLLDKSVLQLSVTALFYLDISRKIHLQGVRARWPKDTKRRAPQHAGERAGWGEGACFGSSFYMFFPLLGPALCKLGQPGVLFVLPEVLTLVFRPSFVLFSRAFPSLSFSHRHSGLFFPILNT